LAIWRFGDLAIWRLTYSAAPARGLPSKGEIFDIPPAPFKGGDGMVSRMKRGDGQQNGERRRLAYTKNFGERLKQISKSVNQ